MFSIYLVLPSLYIIFLACMSIISATMREIEQPANSPEKSNDQ